MAIRSKTKTQRVRVVVPWAHPDWEDDGRTQTQFKDEVDINNIVARYLRGDDISRYQRAAHYHGEDFPTSMDLTEAMNITIKAQQAFADLPADDRDFFGNDPINFIKYMESPEHVEDSIKRGYRVKKDKGGNPPASDGATGTPVADQGQSAPNNSSSTSKEKGS